MRLIVDLTLPTDARLISQTRRMLSGYLAEMGIDEEDASDAVLALSEACANVMRHAFATAGHSFHLTAELDPEEVVLVVEDDGIGLPSGLPSGSGDVMPEPSATSGRGLQLIRQLMTSVEMETSPARQGTRLAMRKSLRAADLS